MGMDWSPPPKLWVDNCFDIFVLKLCDTIFTYYKSWAASELLYPSFLFAINIGEKFAVQPMRFIALLKTTRVKVNKNIDSVSGNEPFMFCRGFSPDFVMSNDSWFN